MNLPWDLGLLAAIVFFGIFEARAFRYPEHQNTLSRWIFNIGKTWPLSIFLMGMLCGGLAVHFFWHWCPDIGAGVGFMIDLSPPGRLASYGR